MLTIQLIVKDNENVVRTALKSLLPLNSEIRVADLGSKDHSREICEEFGATIHYFRDVEDYSSVRNKLLGEDWNLYIHPWEKLISGHEQILKATGSSYYLDIYQDKNIVRDTRLFRGQKFQYPVYETLAKAGEAKLPQGIIWSSSHRRYENAMDIIESWRNRSGAREPYYYLAWELLGQGKFESFENIAKHYLSLEDLPKSSLMLRYRLAQTQLYYLNKPSEAATNALCCVGAKPLMAEFWCLLADVYYAQKLYPQAKELYENAMILGARRPGDDDWPVELEKYKQYPTQMLQSCKDLSNYKMYGQK
jgi:glycosyltransferase involved in cell wall biosynthesis